MQWLRALGVAAMNALRHFFTWLLEVTDRILGTLGLPSTWRDNILAGVATTLLVALAALVWRVSVRLLSLIQRSTLKHASGSPGFEIDTEKAYLRWMYLRTRNVASVWSARPQRNALPLIPVPTPGRRSKLYWKDRLRLRFREAFVQARLFRHNLQDYRRNPVLAESDLSVRAGFGRRVKIRNLAKELRRFRKIVVLGDPGSGKSVCLRQLAASLATSGLKSKGAARTLPVFMDMGRYDGWLDLERRQPSAVIEFIRRSLLEEPCIREAPGTHSLLYVAEHLEDLLSQGRITLIFDALDEMPQDGYQERYAELRTFMEAWEPAGNRFVYSCRTLDYDPSFTVDEVIIDPFDLARIRSFIELNAPLMSGELYRRISEDESLAEMVATPFFLQALVFINQQTGQGMAPSVPHIPESRGRLLKEFADRLIEREIELKQSERLEAIPQGIECLRGFLGALAFALHNRREKGTSIRSEDLADLWHVYPDWQRLLQVATRARILGKRINPETSEENDSPPDRIEFVHHRLEELFAAEELTRHFERGLPIETYLENIWWQETVILAIGSLDNPKPILENILAMRPGSSEWLSAVALEAKKPLTDLRITHIAAGHGPPVETTEPAKAKLHGLLDDIKSSHANWRSQLLDLPLVVKGLSRARGVLEQIAKGSSQAAPWNELVRRGEALSRDRNLFIAAQALGQFPKDRFGDFKGLLQRNLRVLVEDGNSLLKVRALRALRFVASPEILPTLEVAFYQKSSWVKATALRILFRLNLRDHRAREVVKEVIWRSFVRVVKSPFLLLEDSREGTIFDLFRGLMYGLRRERGGLLLAIQALTAWITASVWVVLMIAIGFALFLGLFGSVFSVVLLALVLLALVLLVLLGPALLRIPWKLNSMLSDRVVVQALLDYAVIGALFNQMPFREAALVFICSVSLSLLSKLDSVERIELVRNVARSGMLMFLSTSLPLTKISMTFALVAVLDLWFTIRRAAREHLLNVDLAKGTLIFVGGSVSLWLGKEIVRAVHLGRITKVVFSVGFMSLLLVFFGLGLLEFSLYGIRGIRAAIRSRQLRISRNLGEHFLYVLRVARDPSIPTRAQVNSMMTLLNVPLTEPVVIERLLDLAAEDLPAPLKDMVFQVADAIEKRIHRGQPGISLESSAPVGKGLSAVSVSSLFRPILSITLACAILVCATAGYISMRPHAPFSPEQVGGPTGQLSIGLLLLAAVLLTMGRRSSWRLYSLLGGLGLVANSFSFSFQSDLLSTFLGMPEILLPMLGGLIGSASVVAYCFYVLDTESPADFKGFPVLAMGAVIIVALLTSLFLEDLNSLKRQPLPRFEAASSSRMRLAGLPTDGRVVRVALMGVDSETELPRLDDSFPETRVKTSGFLGEAERPARPDELVIPSGVFAGEVWIQGRSDLPLIWTVMPYSCLEVSSAGRSEVTFSLSRRCPLRLRRLLALTYDRRRSPAIKRRVNPGSLETRIKEGGSLWGDTFSGFVRPVWSPVWK